MNVITYIGTAAARDVIRTYEFGPSNKKLKMNVLLTTYEITLRDSKELGDIKWQVLAVDEVRLRALCLVYAGAVLSVGALGSLLTLLFVVLTGPPAQELGKPAVRGTASVPGCFEGAHHRHAVAEQRQRCDFPLVRFMVITNAQGPPPHFCAHLCICNDLICSIMGQHMGSGALTLTDESFIMF